MEDKIIRTVVFMLFAVSIYYATLYVNILEHEDAHAATCRLFGGTPEIQFDKFAIFTTSAKTICTFQDGINPEDERYFNSISSSNEIMSYNLHSIFFMTTLHICLIFLFFELFH